MDLIVKVYALLSHVLLFYHMHGIRYIGYSVFEDLLDCIDIGRRSVLCLSFYNRYLLYGMIKLLYILYLSIINQK